jgi:hypothetical protein
MQSGEILSTVTYRKQLMEVREWQQLLRSCRSQEVRERQVVAESARLVFAYISSH